MLPESKQYNNEVQAVRRDHHRRIGSSGQAGVVVEGAGPHNGLPACLRSNPTHTGARCHPVCRRPAQRGAGRRPGRHLRARPVGHCPNLAPRATVCSACPGSTADGMAGPAS